MELLQWRTEEEILALAGTPVGAEQLGDELADVVIYMSQLASALGLDLGECVDAKIRRNEERFPPTATPPR